MNDEDYIVLDQYGNYWAGDGWSENPEKAIDLRIQNAAELVMENLPSDILIGLDGSQRWTIGSYPPHFSSRRLQ